MEFQITHHSGFSAPEDALDLLFARLGLRHDGVSFVKGSSQIRATLLEDLPPTVTRDEREEIGRELVLGIVRQACEGAPELKFAWYAVGPQRR